MRYYREFKLRKYFAFWHRRTTRAKYEKRRKEFQVTVSNTYKYQNFEHFLKSFEKSQFLLAEVELAQPILAVSALIDELNNMELLPKLSASHWCYSEFKFWDLCSVL